MAKVSGQGRFYRRVPGKNVKGPGTVRCPVLCPVLCSGISGDGDKWLYGGG